MDDHVRKTPASSDLLTDVALCRERITRELLEEISENRTPSYLPALIGGCKRLLDEVEGVREVSPSPEVEGAAQG